MQDEKKWYLSKTIWGGIVALCAALAGIVGIEVDAASHEALAAALTNAAAAVGAIVAIIGRLDAVKTIR